MAGSYVKEEKDEVNRCGAKVETQTPMSVRLLYPDGGYLLCNPSTMIDLCAVRSMARFAGRLLGEVSQVSEDMRASIPKIRMGWGKA